MVTEKDYARPVWPTVDAEQAEYQPQETFQVMLDPAGQPFCLYTD